MHVCGVRRGEALTRSLGNGGDLQPLPMAARRRADTVLSAAADGRLSRTEPMSEAEELSAIYDSAKWLVAEASVTLLPDFPYIGTAGLVPPPTPREVGERATKRLHAMNEPKQKLFNEIAPHPLSAPDLPWVSLGKIRGRNYLHVAAEYARRVWQAFMRRLTALYHEGLPRAGGLVPARERGSLADCWKDLPLDEIRAEIKDLGVDPLELRDRLTEECEQRSRAEVLDAAEKLAEAVTFLTGPKLDYYLAEQWPTPEFSEEQIRARKLDRLDEHWRRLMQRLKKVRPLLDQWQGVLSRLHGDRVGCGSIRATSWVAVIVRFAERLNDLIGLARGAADRELSRKVRDQSTDAERYVLEINYPELYRRIAALGWDADAVADGLTMEREPKTTATTLPVEPAIDAEAVRRHLLPVVREIVGDAAKELPRESPPPKGRENDDASPASRDSRRWLAEAMVCKLEHPEWSDRKIASYVRVAPSTLSRNEMYQEAKARAQLQKDQRPRGFIQKNPDTGQTDVEAYADDDDSDS